MKKLALITLGVIVLLVAVVLVGPSIIDWNGFKPRIAAAVRSSTGRELHIDGDLRVSLLPKLRVSAGGIHLSNAAGMAAPEMLSVGSFALEVEPWPLLGKRLVIDSLAVENPSINLEIDKTGTPNWVFAPPSAAPAEAPAVKPGEETGSMLTGIQLGNVRLEQGQISYRDATTGQTLDAKSINLSAAMAESASPLLLKGQMTLNDEPLAAEFSIDSLDRLSQGEPAKVRLAVDTKQLKAHFDGTALQRPAPGLGGTFDLDIPSVGRLLAWLHRPLEQSQPDPGPIKIHAALASEGGKTSLTDASILGTALKATATGSVDASGPITKLSLNVESSVLDIDRYLPSPSKEKGQVPPRAQAQAPSKNLLAMLSDKPFELSALRKTEAEVKVMIAGVKAMGYQLGRIAFDATAKAGVFNANLSELALYGGDITGTMKLDGSGNMLGLDTAMKIDHVKIDELAHAADGAPSVSGVVSAALNASAQGASPRALVESLRGKLALDLGGVSMKETAARAISGLMLNLDLPGPDKQATLKGSLTYNGERVDADATVGPLRQLLSGERSPAKITVTSKLVSLGYDGALQQQPVPGLDGTFDVDVPSMGKLAAWLGQPLDAKQPDPGPLKVHAVLVSDGAKSALKEAVITGKALKARVEAKLDGSQKIVAFNVTIDVQQADVNAYLPPEQKGAAVKPKGTTPEQQPTGWSTAPFNVAALTQANGEAKVQLASVRYRDLDITQGLIEATLANRVLNISIEKLALAQGTINGAVALDASGAVPKLDYQASVAGIQARPLLKTLAGSDRLGGTVEFQTNSKGSGGNQKELVESLNGAGQFKVLDGAIYGINLASALRQVGSLGFSGGETEKTDFAELSGSYTIKNGIVENRDLKMLAPLVRLTGGGTVPMPPQTIDYALEAKLVGSLQGQGGRDALAGLPIPIKITGPWNNPSYQVDWKGAFSEMAKDPERLKDLPANLKKSAKDLGVALPIPGASGDTLKGIPGTPKGILSPNAPAPSGQPPAGTPQQQPSTPSLPKIPKGLFGN